MFEKLNTPILPQGYKINGIACGLKKVKKDLALLVSENLCNSAGTYTTNKVKAAPVIWDQYLTESKFKTKAIIVNSGNANACTSLQGEKDNEEIASTLATQLNCDKTNVLVCSTGVIGVPLDMGIYKKGIDLITPSVDTTNENLDNFSTAILTTDTTKKIVSVKTLIDGKEVIITGVAKGSGMIHPNMATMLSFIFTDANIDQATLQSLLGNTIEDTYNMISVDGDTSTNDTVLSLANGSANNTLIKKGSNSYETFKEAFMYVNTYLAKEIVKDGEGASKFIEVSLTGAKTQKDAKNIARTVISSSLVKAAFFGSDANWGRILCAMGYSDSSFDVDKVTIHFESNKGKICVVENGQPIKFDEDKAKEILLEKTIIVLIDLNDGSFSSKAWGCDLTYDYVKINGDYRS
ncbi:MAG: bifunctional glutamate N-acetyltransferase/amino-acid acetyltransferase ArgJ [Sphaerochaetaceae bacterium]|nr:bifunctional glutamate N-acetyltransferase/amino-acid acetyltransferase ArgJ [Sphaerochaetaceae bacterium]MDC7236394.1 bifunctional glutamate N-acetyltransferase/amino-acid acetyltransferase ArgJ [Sphaerochaetaceae bacterium]MDC7251080.1 bifunctional glutamate N-acetyltransferase/amino-acid acetyltransferase ArgJ [Sphaerochaetaceae bacterium]